MQGKPFSRMDLTPLVGVLLALFAATATIGWAPGETEAFESYHSGCNLPAYGIDYGSLPKHIIVSANADGSVSLSGRPVPREAFVTELRHLASLERAPGIWVRADADVAYGEVFALFREIEKAGLGAEMDIINEDLG